ncbi:MAG: hypothetical protein NTU57_00410 [Candidatus Aenigmarchaeota archaeon]|nr:hypothetical protein [Candidatus Aenigmarchaeota archaeon]
MPKLQQISGTFVISIPYEKIRRKGWKKGQVLDWSEYPNGDLVLMEVPE